MVAAGIDKKNVSPATRDKAGEMRPSVLPGEAELLSRIQQGDETAFEQLFHHYRDKVYSIALKLTSSTMLAEEIVQDVFLKIWLKREQLHEVEHFRAYLYTIVRNHTFNHLKAIAHRQISLTDINPGDIAPYNRADFPVLEKENEKILAEAVHTLPPQQKLVYKLLREDGLKREEVSRKMGISPETVKAHIAHAMRSIRAFCLARIGGLLLLFYFL